MQKTIRKTLLETQVARPGLGKRQDTAQLTVLGDGLLQVKPLVIFKDNSGSDKA